MAVNNDGNAIKYKDGNWSTPDDIDGGSTIDYGFSTGEGLADSPSGLDTIACATPEYCVAADNDGNLLEYRSSVWSSPQSVIGGGVVNTYITDVSCGLKEFCMGISSGADVVSDLDGHWSALQELNRITELHSISCASRSFCVTVDSSGFVYTYKSGHWSKGRQIDDGRDLTAVSCATERFCVAIDRSGHVVTYDGDRWTGTHDLGSGAIVQALSCPTADFCMAVGDHGTVYSAVRG
jgi:hypothetical protein